MPSSMIHPMIQLGRAHHYLLSGQIDLAKFYLRGLMRQRPSRYWFSAGQALEAIRRGNLRRADAIFRAMYHLMGGGQA
jgi:hypothetical protein